MDVIDLASNVAESVITNNIVFIASAVYKTEDMKWHRFSVEQNSQPFVKVRTEFRESTCKLCQCIAIDVCIILTVATTGKLMYTYDYLTAC